MGTPDLLPTMRALLLSLALNVCLVAFIGLNFSSRAASSNHHLMMAGPRAPMTRFSVPSRTACAAVPKRTIGGAKKTVAPPKKTVAPARKTVAPAKKTVAPQERLLPLQRKLLLLQGTVAPAKKTV